MKQALRLMAAATIGVALFCAGTTAVFSADSKEPTSAELLQSGKAEVAKGNQEKARQTLQAALAAAEKANDAMAVAEACNEMANSFMASGDVMKAAEYATRAKDTALKILMGDVKTAPLAMQLARNEEHSSVWIGHMMKGQFALEKKDYPLAETEYQSALTKAKEYAPEGMPSASAMSGLGRVYVATEKYKQAEPLLTQSIELFEKNWTPVTKSAALDAADAMTSLAVVYEKTGRADELKKLNERIKTARETQTLR